MYIYHKVMVRLPIVSFYNVFLNRNFIILSCCIILMLLVDRTTNKKDIHIAVNLCLCRYLFEPQHDSLTTFSGVKDTAQGYPIVPNRPDCPCILCFSRTFFPLIFRIYYFKFSKGVGRYAPISTIHMEAAMCDARNQTLSISKVSKDS